MSPPSFYETLSPLEKKYWEALYALFQRVQPAKPEKGIQALLIRARKLVDEQNVLPEAALERILREATERTDRRVELLNRCALKSAQSSETIEEEP